MGFVLLVQKDYEKAPTSPTRIMSALRARLALKAVLPDASDKLGMALFRRELTVWAGFRHRNIIPLIEIVDAGDDGWIAAMNWCEGSLRRLLNEKGRLSVKTATNIIVSLIDGLAHAYSQDQVLHLDLKPENILYDQDLVFNENDDDPFNDYRFMVADWGIASVKQPRLNAIAGIPPTAESVQRTFNNMGTLLYMAPERFKQGVKSSIASDVYSLGMIYLEMLIGGLPFHAKMHPVQSILTARYEVDAASLLYSTDVPKSVSALILSMISFSPIDRPNDYPRLKSSIIRAAGQHLGLFSRIFK